ncbi:hypothetical protein CYG68_20810 [Morganella morganii]|uniref:Uncharacterized protein n=1 Tax=Morganella morganii TaxID=582 RepID=A0A8I0PZU6_MORMO|nr:hypothetical protein [Morganella morganii]MBE8614775.1 hypothetical protein [Morganella morganii]
MNNPVMDSPEALGFALCRLLPEMSQGFIIQTRSGEIQVSADNSLPFVRETDRLLKKVISRIQRESYGNDCDFLAPLPSFSPVNESNL